MLKILFSFLLCASFTVLLAQDSDEIKHLMENKRYSSAEKILEEKVQSGDDSPEYNYLLVSAYLQQDKPYEAKNFIENKNLMEGGNDNPLNKIAYASYLLRTDQSEKAKQIFEELLADKKTKKNVALLLKIADAYISNGDKYINDALSVLDIAEKRDKHNASVQVLKGNAYRKIHDGSNAYVAFQSALKDDPSNIAAHYQLGKIFVTQKAEDLYMEQFNKAYALDSNYAPVLKAFYDHYYYKDLKLAKAYLEKYIRHTDYSVENDYALADMYYLNKDYDKAIDLAKNILEGENDKAQPRLYKMIAYSYNEIGNKEEAWTNLQQYFAKEDPKNFVSKDYEFKAKLLMDQPDKMNEALANYEKAFALDSLDERKLDYATKIAEGYKELKEFNSQAIWLGKIYELKKDRTNVDLFNWGLAHFKGGDNIMADSVFRRYIEMYPENIYGYYWNAQVNAAIDTSLELGLAIPYYKKIIEIGETDTSANKAMLLKAYGYLGGYEANTKKDYPASLAYFEKFLELDPENEDANKYAEILKNWIENPETNPANTSSASEEEKENQDMKEDSDKEKQDTKKNKEGND